jgi:hypothetical protein
MILTDKDAQTLSQNKNFTPVTLSQTQLNQQPRVNDLKLQDSQTNQQVVSTKQARKALSKAVRKQRISVKINDNNQFKITERTRLDFSTITNTLRTEKLK